MADEDEILATLAYVDAELEKSAGFIDRNVNRVKGFVQGYKNVGAFQNAQHAHNTASAAIAGTQAAQRPGLFKRIEQRVEGGLARGKAEGQLHDLQHHQQQMNQAAAHLEQHTGQPGQYHQGPDYSRMTGADLMHYQRDPQGFMAAQAAQPQPGGSMGWALPAAGAAAVAGLGGMYLWNRNRQQQQQQQQQYGYPYYAKMGEEKTAFISHFIPHVAVNAGALAAHHHSNLNEVLSHQAFQLGLQGKDLHPTRAKALEMAIGPEALAGFSSARAMGEKLRGLSPEAQRMAMRGMMKGYDMAGMPTSTPLLGGIRQAMGHHLAGTAPEFQGKGVGAKLFGKVMTDLTQQTYDPSQKQNILQRGLGHLRGALPAVPVALMGAVDPWAPAVHFGINKARDLIGQSRWGANFMKDQVREGLQGAAPSPAKQKAMQLILSPAYYDAHQIGKDLRHSEAGIPAAMYMQHEYANRQRNMMNEPHMLAAAGPGVGGGYGAPPPAPQGGGGGFMRNYALPAAGAAGIAGLGYAAYRGSQAANEQSARMQDHFTNSAHNMSNPLPPMTVTASYDEFCEEKLANVYAPVYPSMQNALSTSMAQQLATKFVGEPIDAAHKVLKKKLYDEPKQQAAYDEAVSGDEMLQEAHRTNPKGLQETFSTLKTFAPSMAKNPQATKSFLRQATMSGMHGGGPDFATIRLLAETEKFIQNSKGRGTNS
jgi:hypothetical protein